MLSHLLLARLYMTPQQPSWALTSRKKPSDTRKPADIRAARDAVSLSDDSESGWAATWRRHRDLLRRHH